MIVRLAFQLFVLDVVAEAFSGSAQGEASLPETVIVTLNNIRYPLVSPYFPGMGLQFIIARRPPPCVTFVAEYEVIHRTFHDLLV